MKEHKHAEILRAIADGKEVEFFCDGYWNSPHHDWIIAITPFNRSEFEWRIKPEPKPDVVKYAKFLFDSKFNTSIFYFLSDNQEYANLKIIIDGETGDPKYIEVIK